MGVLKYVGLVGLVGLALMISCKPCNRAARYVERGRIICPDMTIMDSLTHAVPVPAVHVTGAIKRDSTLVGYLTREILIEAQGEPLEVVIERLIYERCLEEDTVRINLEGARIKLWFQDGELRHQYDRLKSMVQIKTPRLVINPTKEVVQWEWAGAFIMAGTLIGLLIGLFFANRRR